MNPGPVTSGSGKLRPAGRGLTRWWTRAGRRLALGFLAATALGVADHSRARTGGAWGTSGQAVTRCEVLAVIAGESTTMMATLAQHWPFWGGGLVLGTTAIGLVNWITRQRRRVVQLPEVLAVVAAERKRIAADLHDDLGSRLAEIGLLSTTAALSRLSASQLRERWERIGHQADRSVRSLDHIVWAINPVNDCVSSVVDYFCTHARQFLQEASLRCRFEVAASFPHRMLGPEARHQLFLAFKEALHNVVRHAGATEVRIAIALRREALVVAVEDNGRGLPERLPPHGADGLRNMQQRLERLNGACLFRSLPGRGLSVCFRLPMERGPRSWRARARQVMLRLQGRRTERAAPGSGPNSVERTADSKSSAA